MFRLVGWILGAVAGCGARTAAPSAAGSAEQEDPCLGPADAERFVVYLHGVDRPTPGPQEQRHRALLARIGEARGIRFALPRAREACGDDTCWGWALDPEERARAVQAVADATSRCFPPEARFGVVGFSSGGYLRRLQAKSARIERRSFPGGHELPAAALEDELVRRFEQDP